jgi:uncharacterized protein (DUF2062 family)
MSLAKEPRVTENAGWLAKLKAHLAEETGAVAPDGHRRTFRERFLHMMGRDDPPEIVAASFALGVAISFTPLIGLHWMMALVLAFLLRLNKIDVLLGTLVVNPLTLGPVSAIAIPLGRALLHARRYAIHALPWHDFFRRSFWREAGPTMRAIGLQWGVGMFALSFLVGALVYMVLLRVIRARRARHAAPVAAPGRAPAPLRPESSTEPL